MPLEFSEDLLPKPVLATEKQVSNMRIAINAARESPDLKRKVGCVLIHPSGYSVSTGCNTFPDKVLINSARLSKEGGAKYLWTEHAERMALFDAAKHRRWTKGLIAYTTRFPCADCMRGFIQSGIAELVTFAPELDTSKFAEHYKVATLMAIEASLKITILREEGGLKDWDKDL